MWWALQLAVVADKPGWLTVPTPGLLVELAGSLQPELALRRNQPVMIGAPRQSVAGRAG
jgi:hypothetical protein